ncbi:activator of 90 kDa heat shock protein ATPase homolog 1-like [Glandiceps talaboti]
MAKWGEGDPRWIVEERADATNVNNWHWTEKKATAWSKDKLKEIFVGLKVEDERGCCEITAMPKCDGEATANNRKAKLIFFYEWEIKLEWNGNLAGCETKLEGTVEIPNLSDENEADEVDFNVSVKKETVESRTLKEIMRGKGRELMKEQIAKYIKLLREEYSQGMILPTKQNASSNAKPSTPPQKTQNKSSVTSEIKNFQNLQVGVKINTSKIKEKQDFKCEASDLYDALTNVQKVQAFMRARAEMEVEPEGRFSLLDGNITGQYVELVPNKKIVQRWRYKSWPEEHYSTVTMEMEEKSDHTELVLTQTGVPDNELDRTKEGWSRYYWQSINSTFGFSSRIF